MKSSIPQAPVPSGYHFNDVQIEMSFKPFWDNTPETREAVCRELFYQWMPLARHSESISIMLWIGDGSELLEYTGDLDEEFEWGRYYGSANAIHADPMPDNGDPGHHAMYGHIAGRDPENRGVHMTPYLYREQPAKFSYRWLKELTQTLKRIGHEITGKTIFVGETFDIGPEFAVSRFKYKWHREICGAGALFGGKFIRCDVTLEGDDRKYAAYPTGIPDKLPFGTFLGAQTQAFFTDCGFDFLWLSNGFGFALEPWALTGAIFDGKEFHTSTAEETSRKIQQFWKYFRSTAPTIHVRTRGTNLATGIDLGSDASPWREIFAEVPEVDAPVNSPWAALDGDVGLELSGWMSHIAKIPPHNRYRFRYYIHDPWWNNSPYLDRYQRSPFDIYLPLAVSRLADDGTIQPPTDIALLSIDDTNGKLPVVVPIEVTSYILHAREYQPDSPAPLVWVYPWDAYHDMLKNPTMKPEVPFFGDWFVRGAITHTIPLNTVANAELLFQLLDRGDKTLAGSILFAPVIPEAFEFNQKLLKYAQEGASVLFYGPLVDAPALREFFGISCDAPLTGDFQVTGGDSVHQGGQVVRHLAYLSAGGWTETGGSEILASGTQAGKQRTAVAIREFPSGGKIGWVRGSLATSEYIPEQDNKIRGPRLEELSGKSFLPTEKLVRLLLSRMGLGIEVRKTGEPQMDPMLCIHRHKNAFVFSGFQPEAQSAISLGFELGAPLFIGMQNQVENNTLHYSGNTAWHHVSRIFVQQETSAQVECRIVPPIQYGVTARLLVTGLTNATVRFFPEPGIEDSLKILRNPMFPYFIGDFVTPNFVQHPQGKHVVVENVSGELIFSW